MPEEQQSRSQVYQADSPKAPVQNGQPQDGQKDGQSAVKFPATNQNGHNGHDGSKYAEKKDDDKKGDDGEGDDKGGKKPSSPLKTFLIGAAVLALLIAAIIYGSAYFTYASNHVSTDDAYVTGNLVNVSPLISGTLNSLTVEEGDTVKKGQLVGRLEDSGQKSSYAQAQANYRAAQSQLPQAEQNLLYQQQATDAAIRKAQADLASQRAATAGAKQQVALSRGQVLNQVVQAQSQVEQARRQAEQFQAQSRSALAAVNSQRQTVKTAQRAADAADAQISGAGANAVRTANDQKRYAVLVKQEAVTPQQYDSAAASAVSARSNLDAVRFQASQAHSQVNAARANVSQAQAQYQAALRAAEAAQQNVAVAQATLGIARANLGQIGVQQSNVVNKLGQDASAQADLSTAQAGQTQVGVRRDQIKTFQAQANSSKAALQNAQVVLNDTFLYAPNEGTVVKKTVNVGASLSPGQTILTITQGQYVYVSANFKETQLRNVKPGQPVDVEVDSFPGLVFKGYVRSINETTGATNALLPPDNATGNFTKVVQRVSVRIELQAAKDDDKKYAHAQDIHNLRQGMSVVATIDVSSGRH